MAWGGRTPLYSPLPARCHLWGGGVHLHGLPQSSSTLCPRRASLLSGLEGLLSSLHKGFQSCFEGASSSVLSVQLTAFWILLNPQHPSLCNAMWVTRGLPCPAWLIQTYCGCARAQMYELFMQGMEVKLSPLGSAF